MNVRYYMLEFLVISSSFFSYTRPLHITFTYTTYAQQIHLDNFFNELLANDRLVFRSMCNFRIKQFFRSGN